MIFRVSVVAVVLGVGIWLALPSLRAPAPLPPPVSVADACTIKRDRPQWYKATRKAAREWDVPAPVILAIIWRESSFRARVRPPRRGGWWIFPGKPISTAYGFSQALDGTWDWYQNDRDAPEARRDHYADAADFVGWYMNQSRKQLGFSSDDARLHYLAYHQGHGGYRSGRWRDNARLKKAAAQVHDMTLAYDAQLFDCDALHAHERTLRETPVPRPRPGSIIATIPEPKPKPKRESASL